MREEPGLIAARLSDQINKRNVDVTLDVHVDKLVVRRKSSA